LTTTATLTIRNKGQFTDFATDLLLNPECVSLAAGSLHPVVH